MSDYLKTYDANWKRIMSYKELLVSDYQLCAGNIAYGLRNLIVGDDEPSHVSDLRDSEICPRDLKRVRDLAEMGSYSLAYIQAIGGWIRILWKGDAYESVPAICSAVTYWYDDWAGTEGNDDGIELIEYMNLLHALIDLVDNHII